MVLGVRGKQGTSSGVFEQGYLKQGYGMGSRRGMGRDMETTKKSGSDFGMQGNLQPEGTGQLILQRNGAGGIKQSTEQNKRQRSAPAGLRYRETALVMLLIGFLYIKWVFSSVALGAGTVAFTILFCCTAAWYMAANGMKQTKTSLVYLGIVGAAALNFVLIDSPFSVLNLLFVQAAAVYWICVTTGRRISGTLSGYIVGDGILQLILVPFGNFGREAAALCAGRRPQALSGSGLLRGAETAIASGNGMDAGMQGETAAAGNDKAGAAGSEEIAAARKKRITNVLLALCGVLLVMPVLLIVIFLLISADAAFEQFISQIDLQIRLPENFGVWVMEFCAGIPVACYLFGSLYGNVTGRHTGILTKQSFDRGVDSVKIVPPVMSCAALGALIAVYLLFFITQAGYLFSAFRDQLPAAMTYADYARRGFFELCAVTGINLVVMAAALLFTARPVQTGIAAQGAEKFGKTGSRGTGLGASGVGADKAAPGGNGTFKPGQAPKSLRCAAAMLCVLTMLLIGTALSKMGMYIHYYGLTQLRFFTSAFMFLLLLAFGVILARQLREFPCGRVLAVLSIAGFLVLSYSNADGLIARYNIARYEAGTLAELDVEMLSGLSAGSVKPVHDFYMRTEDEAMKRRIRQSFGLDLLSMQDEFGIAAGNDTFARLRDWNYQRWQAGRMLSEMATVKTADSAR